MGVVQVMEFWWALYEILELILGSGTGPRLTPLVLVPAILISLAALFVSSNVEVRSRDGQLVDWVFRAVLVIFAIELAIRLWLFEFGMKRHGRVHHQFWGRAVSLQPAKPDRSDGDLAIGSGVKIS